LLNNIGFPLGENPEGFVLVLDVETFLMVNAFIGEAGIPITAYLEHSHGLPLFAKSRHRFPLQKDGKVVHKFPMGFLLS
jgi:hypothetical protein